MSARVEPVLVSVQEAAQMLSVTPWTAYQLCDKGKLRSGYEGRRRLVSVESVRAYADCLMGGTGAPQPS